MSGRWLGHLTLVVIAAAAACSPSPSGPEAGPDSGPAPIRPAAHLDCDSPEDIRARIDALEADGTLNSGRATALRNGRLLLGRQLPRTTGRPHQHEQ